jgi:hypothetical protein
MNLSKETWELIVEGLQDKIQVVEGLVNYHFETAGKRLTEIESLRKDLIDKCNEVTELKSRLRVYEKRDKVEHFIKQMGRRYNPSATGIGWSWISLFYSLYPSADPAQFRIRGRAKQEIINLLRSGELVVYDDGETIGKP